MRIMAGVGDLVQRTGNGRPGQILGGQMIEMSGDAVYSLHRVQGDKKHGVFSSVSKPRLIVCHWFGIKITRIVCQWFGLKTTGMVCQWFDLKTGGDSFYWFDLKTGGCGFPGLGLKTGSCGLVIWVLNHGDDFSKFGHKTGGNSFLLWSSKPSEPQLSVAPQI
jgi:hypothetical protein